MLALLGQPAATRAAGGIVAVQPTPDPFGAILRPVAIARVQGRVDNASALITGRGMAVLHFVPGQPPPMIIVDYGRDVGGLPVIDIAKTDGAPILNAIYSESLRYMFPLGDGAPGFIHPPADSTRLDAFAVTAPGRIPDHEIQGGERYQAITLASPGSVAVSLLGIRSLTADPPTSNNSGAFTASDPALTKIWELGARTLQLCEIPVQSLPPLLTETSAGLLAAGTSPAVYQMGVPWTDYDVTVDAKFLRNEAALIVRSSTMQALDLTFDTSNDRLGVPGVLVVSTNRGFGEEQNAVTKLPIGLAPNTWHRISVKLRGGSAAVAIDNRPIGTFVTTTTHGTVGFRSPIDGAAVFRDLLVQSPDGKTIFESPLLSSDVPRQFAAGTNHLPLIIDGAKRDRLVWVGDLAIEGPTLFYSSGEDKYVAGSLDLLGSFHQPDGEIATDSTPLMDPSLGSGPTLPDSVGFLSLPYSIHYINAAYDYWLYSGNDDFIRRHWPVIKRELSYLAAHTGSDDLIRTTAADGMDWALDTQTGAVTAYNALYVRALHNAAAIARGLGDTAYADELVRQGARVVRSVNRELFDEKTDVYDISTNLRGTYAQDANVMAVLSGIAAPARGVIALGKASAVLATPFGPRGFSSVNGFNNVISPFMSGFEVEARFGEGDAMGALALIRRLWGPMAVRSDYYTGADIEALGPTGAIEPSSRSLAHGWSSAPTAELSKYVLGVRPSSPGFRSWLIKPEPGDLTWAKGRVPTPHGPITVAWQLDLKSGHFHLDASVPRNTSGIISVPTRQGQTVTINGIESRVTTVNAMGVRYVNSPVLRAGIYHVTVGY